MGVGVEIVLKSGATCSLVSKRSGALDSCMPTQADGDNEHENKKKTTKHATTIN